MTEGGLFQEDPLPYGAGKATPAQKYLREIERALKRGDATEHTHRGALKELLEALQPGIVATNEPKRTECGAPDYVISRERAGLGLGHIEAKDVGTDLHREERGDQVGRYRAALPNLLLTDYLEFRWFVDGHRREVFRLANALPGGRIAPAAEGELDRARRLLIAFLSQRPGPIASAEELARRLAGLAHLIREAIVRAFQGHRASVQLRDWRDAFAATLLPELAPQDHPQHEAEAVNEFADMFAQTLAYGMFSARVAAGTGTFTREKAQRLIPRTNPFLRAFFEQITGSALDDEPFAGYVEDLIQGLDQADLFAVLEGFGRRAARRDPVVHFYETFLQAYDPKLRELRGVYYTPEPVVNYIVRSIDRVLKRKFGIKAGLADYQKVRVTDPESGAAVGPETHRVLVLDPAAGTATFLYAVLDFIRAQFKTRKRAGQWTGYVHEHLLPRLFGFELLMAPYAVAHFKLGLALAAMDEEPLLRQQWSYEPRAGERLNIFLTNTLDDLEHAAEQLGPLRALSDEANSAHEIKKAKPVLIVLGNPPYSGQSANQGQWISALVRDYYLCDGQPLGERNPKWLQDDYVKFIRWGQWRIERTGQGVLAFITNHGYLDNPTFRGMRQHLMRTFDEIHILNLHGSSKKKETVPGTAQPDKNVFDIQQGVAIGIFVKLPPGARTAKGQGGLATVFHADLWGAQRKTKYDWLEANHLDTTAWTPLAPATPHYLFVPQDTRRLAEYERGWRITEMMPVNSLGIATGRDRLTVAFTRGDLQERLQRFLELDSEEARRCFQLGPDSRDWQVKLAQQDLSRLDWGSHLRPILYRPFDCRQTCYTGASRGFLCMARHDVMRHFLRGEPNLGLSTTRSVEIREGWQHVFATAEIIQLHSVSLKEVNYLFPLYLYPNGALPEEDLFARQDGRRPNLSADFVRDLCGKLRLRFVSEGQGRPGRREVGPEAIFHYAYAVLHSPEYRKRYSQFLRADFPRLPLTADPELFRALAGIGGELVAFHVKGKQGPPGLRYPVKGANLVEEVRYQPAQAKAPGRVWINDRQYFEGVPESAWTFPIGGYRPAQRWLKDRIGRALGFDDQAEYERIVGALIRTRDLMGAVDTCIDQHGGWPLG